MAKSSAERDGTKEELSAKAVQSPSLPLEGIHHVHGSDSLPLGMFSVGDRIPDHILQEDLKICNKIQSCTNMI